MALAAKHDRSLAHALEHSHRVGRMLLKAEDAELSEIKKLADELLASEYKYGPDDAIQGWIGNRHCMEPQAPCMMELDLLRPLLSRTQPCLFFFVL